MIPQRVQVAHIRAGGGIYWLPAERTTEPDPDPLRPGHDRFSYRITSAPPGWQGIPVGCVTVSDEGRTWREWPA